MEIGVRGRRVIMHIDMDAFFASVEQQCCPRYRNKPIAVIGAGKRTVVTASSYQARQFGVKTGMTVPEAKKLCRQIILTPADNEKYTYTSGRIISIFRQYAHRVEVYSIDESFLDMSDSGPEETKAVAVQIKEQIRRELGLTCSAGIGPNKLIAKLASGLSKPDALTVVNPEEVSGLLEALPVNKLCGIGNKTTACLATHGIRTCGELGRASVSWLRQEFGIIGEVLALMGKGIDNSPVIPMEETPPAKSVGHSMTLEKDENKKEKLYNYLMQLAEMVGRRLRREGLCGRTVTLTVRYSDFKTFTRQKTISEHVNYSPDIYKAAAEIFSRLKLKKAVRMLGVTVSHLTVDREVPFLPEEKERKGLIEAVDEINDTYGDFTLTWARLLDKYDHKGIISPSWRPRDGDK